MTDSLRTKAPAVQEVVARLVADLGPDRIVVKVAGGSDAESVTIASSSDPSRAVFISITGMESGRYAVSYDQLRTKRSGDSSIEWQTSSGVVYEGLHWITRKIFDHGVVSGEFDALPAKRRTRR